MFIVSFLIEKTKLFRCNEFEDVYSNLFMFLIFTIIGSIIGYFHLPVEVNMITKSLEKLETQYSNINSTKSNLIETTETSERNISYIIRWSIPIIIIVCVVIVIQYTYSTLLKPLSSVSIVEVESIKRGKSKKSKSAKTKSISSNRKQQQQQSITKSSSMPIIYKQKSNKIKSIQNKNSNKTI